MKAMEFDVAVKQPAEVVWQTHVKNFQVALPAVAPGHYSKVEYMDGPPLAAGGVVKLCYHEGFGHYEYVKFVWDVVDHEKFTFKLTVIDGGALGKHFGGLIYHYKVLPDSTENSSIMSWKIEYDDLEEHNFHDVLKDELIKFSEYIDPHLDNLKKA